MVVAQDATARRRVQLRQASRLRDRMTRQVTLSHREPQVRRLAAAVLRFAGARLRGSTLAIRLVAPPVAPSPRSAWP